MKKFFLASMAMLSVIVFSACSSKDSIAGRAAGQYTVERNTSVVGMPTVIEPDIVKLKVKAEADYFVKITIPSTNYNLGGTVKNIPEFDIHAIPVIDNNENGAYIPNYSFKIEGTKNIVGTIIGDIEEDGDVDLTVQYTYGDMPLTIKQEFESID
jgi:hypothetical protein